MAKTGLFGFGYINEGIFYGKLGDLLGRDVTAQDKQHIHHFVQQELDRGCIEYYTCDKQGGIAVSKAAPQSTREIVAKAVSIGLTDNKGQEILAYVCQHPGQKWSAVYVGARPTVYGILSAYHIGYLNFKNFREANDFICGIHEVLLPGEQWGFPRSEENPALIRRCTRYQILESYLRHTFSKLMLEYNDKNSDNYGKIVFSQDKKYCYFNTGLLTKYAQDLYLTGEVHALREDGIFTCNNPRFVDSKIELVKHYGFAQRDIDPGPGMASFYRSVTEIVYDPSITIDFTESKLEHIIDDGIRRNRFPKKYTVSQTGKPIPPWSLAQMLNNAIKISCMMAQRNYKYVIPQYRPAGVEYVGGKRVRYEGQIQFLMPIYLSADYFSPPDFALVLSRRDGFYVPETILLLPWAYNNARILCKPDNSWLNPSSINPDDLLLDEEDADGEDEGEECAAEEAMEESPSAQKAAEAPAAPAETPAEPQDAPAQAEPAIGQTYTFIPSGRTANQGIRGRIVSTGALGTISRRRLGARNLEELLGKPIAVRVEGRNQLGNTYQLSFAEPDAASPAEAPAEAPAATPAESPARPSQTPQAVQEAAPAPSAEEEADDPWVGKTLEMRFTGTTAAKALKAESDEIKGTISLKRLSGHKAQEFHGLRAQVRVLSPNTCGGSYQCELAEPAEAILARREEAKPAAQPADAPSSRAEKPAKPEKSERPERSAKPERPARASRAAHSSWAWADPANIFTQRPTVVENFRDLAVGQRYNATVRDLVPYGAFVDIGYAEGNVLLHKSQILEGTTLSSGDVLTVWIHALDAQNKKVQVTMHRPN